MKNFHRALNMVVMSESFLDITATILVHGARCGVMVGRGLKVVMGNMA